VSDIRNTSKTTFLAKMGGIGGITAESSWHVKAAAKLIVASRAAIREVLVLESVLTPQVT
jgi:hypothetical protein